MTRSDRITIFCSELQSWFIRSKRTLPWRDLAEKNLDHKAYLILVSEVMLQQTQVSRVIVLYKNFIQRFPRIEDLASASNREVLIAWRGLGYNNRALRLRDTARTVQHQHQGVFPRGIDELQKLPGIGHYTAGAIRNFAFGIPTPCIDVNIRRILHRFFVGIENPDGTWKKSDRYLLALAHEILATALSLPPTTLTAPTPPTLSTADFHAALMDFGSLVCTKNAPKWELMTPKMKTVCKAYGKQISRTPVPDPSKGSARGAAKKVGQKEPGRMMAGRFVPNRIFRGKIIEALRDTSRGLSFDELGETAIADWRMGDHRQWLKNLVRALENDRMVERRNGRILLQS